MPTTTTARTAAATRVPGPPVRYRLSNQQAKELRIRGRRLRIALPAPASDPADLIAWARERLPDDADSVYSAMLAEAYVEPATGDGMPGVLGHLREHWMPDRLMLCVQVVVVELHPLTGIRDKTGAIWQWPGKAFSGEHRWPRPKAGDAPEDSPAGD